MLNQVVFVGRVANQPELFEEDGKKYGKLNIAIQRNTKNSEGIYETDLVNCIVNSSMCNSISEYVRQGDIIGNNVIWYTERQKIINPFIYK